VDIAAFDGVTMSNTLALFERGFSGLAVEANVERFAKMAKRYSEFPLVNLARCYVTPNNVVDLLKGTFVEKEFGFLSLDIDGYEFYVLDKILSEYRPQLICTEINEKIPPPIKFTVEYSDKYVWNEDHFFGQSICKLYEHCEKHNYKLLELHYNNAFMCPSELTELPGLLPETAYNNGYRNKPDRAKRFPWNKDVDQALSMTPDESLAFFQEYFAKYAGQFTMEK